MMSLWSTIVTCPRSRVAKCHLLDIYRYLSPKFYLQFQPFFSQFLAIFCKSQKFYPRSPKFLQRYISHIPDISQLWGYHCLYVTSIGCNICWRVWIHNSICALNIVITTLSYPIMPFYAMNLTVKCGLFHARKQCFWSIQLCRGIFEHLWVQDRLCPAFITL